METERQKRLLGNAPDWRKGIEMMGGRHLIAMIGIVTIFLPAWTFADWRSERIKVLDDQKQSPTAAKDDIVLTSHDDSYDGDKHQEKFSYKYKNIGSKTIKATVTVKAQHHGYYASKPSPKPFRTEKFSFTLGPGEEHEVSGTWKIEKPSDEGDPEMVYADDDHPELFQAAYSDSN